MIAQLISNKYYSQLLNVTYKHFRANYNHLWMANQTQSQQEIITKKNIKGLSGGNSRNSIIMGQIWLMILKVYY